MNSVWRRKRLFALQLIVVAACASLLIVPSQAVAQSGPQFGNWGPGMSPPDQEGVELATPQANGFMPLPSYGGQDSAAVAPYGGVAPTRLYGGCDYDLRGWWWNDGRQTSPSNTPYFMSVYVRQYRTWIQALQDDGTGYYGQCIGSRLNFDIYQGNQYVGRQTGTVTGSSWIYPVPLYRDFGPYAAPAAPAPPGSANLRAAFTWTAYFGSGTETWSPSSTGYPGYPAIVNPPPTVVPIPSSTPRPTPPPPTATPAPPPTAVPTVVRIDTLVPPRGPIGTEVVIVGSGFSPDDNLITFGPSLGMRRADGSPANLVARVGSPEGRTLRFTVPETGPSGILCDDSGSCIGVTAILLETGSYSVSVTNGSGSSNVVRFELTGEGA